MMRVLSLNRGNLAAAAILMTAAAFVPNGNGVATMIASVPLGTVVNVMAPKPKPKSDYVDGLGNKIPLDKFENDLPYNPDVDVSPYADFEKALDAELAKGKPKK